MNWHFWLREAKKGPASLLWHVYDRARLKLFPNYICDKDYWESLRGLHAGRRGFVIGNGPSLKLEDLERLRGDITIASNKIYLAFDQLTWRPTYYSVADPILWPKIKDEVPKHIDLIHMPSSYNPHELPCPVRRWTAVGGADDPPPDARHFSADLTRGIYVASTVTYMNIQLAAHLGLDPIYLIGCDHNYPGETYSHAKKAVEAHEHHHFIKGYRRKGELVLPADIGAMDNAFYCARLFADAHGLGIFNATRGGHLEIFERADLDGLLANNPSDS